MTVYRQTHLKLTPTYERPAEIGKDYAPQAVDGHPKDTWEGVRKVAGMRGTTWNFTNNCERAMRSVRHTQEHVIP